MEARTDTTVRDETADDGPVGIPTEPLTEPPTELPTEPPTEPPIEPPTEPPTELSTELSAETAGAGPANRPVALRRKMCKALVLKGPHAGDVCPNFAGGPFFEHFCYRHTSKKRVQPDPDECDICQEIMPVEYRTSCCKRVFCVSCLKKHEKSGGTVCPSCRAPMGYDVDGVEYSWINLKFHATKLQKRMKDASSYLASPDALTAHLTALMASQKEQALKEVEEEYKQQVQSIEEIHAAELDAWNNNRDGHRDETWKLVESAKQTLSNVSLIRSTRHPNVHMAQAALQMVRDVNDLFDTVIDSEDYMGILEGTTEEVLSDLTTIIQQRLQDLPQASDRRRASTQLAAELPESADSDDADDADASEDSDYEPSETSNAGSTDDGTGASVASDDSSQWESYESTDED